MKSRPRYDILTVIILFTAAPPIQADTTLRVDAAASGANNGSTWCDAYPFLQNALAEAVTRNNDADPLNDVTEIRVAQGIYQPDRDTSNPEGTGNRDATFQLITGVAVKGGYAGCGAPDEDERNPAAYETILTGDLIDPCIAPMDPVSDCCIARPAETYCENEGCWNLVCAQNVTCCSSGWTEPCVDYAEDWCVCVCLDGEDIENSYHVVTASGTDASAVLDGVTITGGNANADPPPPGPPEPRRDGAGLYAENGSPTLINCTFRENIAADEGGGVYNNGGSPSLSGCTFTGNTADVDGGGIYSLNGDLTLSTCLFESNDAEAGEGGGLYSTGGNLTLSGCTFTGNSSGGAGGGMFSAGEGSGATVQITFTDCSFNTNNGQNGSGVALTTDSVGTFSNCTFDGNGTGTGSGWGGGLWLDDHSQATLNPPCLFTGNKAERGGGMAVDRQSVATLDGCEFSENEATASEGGGLRLFDRSTATLSGCVFDHNVANTSGGGLSVMSVSEASATDCTFSFNTTTYSNGGGIHNQTSTTTIQDCTINDNEAAGFGGGVFTEPGSEHAFLTIKGTAQNLCVIKNNYAAYGAGVYTHKDVGLLIENCTVEENGRREQGVITEQGGGIHCGGFETDVQTIRNTLIRANEADQGGGIHVWSITLLIEDSTIAENSARLGGGIYGGGDSYPQINRSRIVQNTAAASGGGILIWTAPADPSDRTSLRNTLVANNTADDGDGGGIAHGSGYLDITNCTIANNTASNVGGGLHVTQYLTSNVVNTIFWGNSAGGNGSQIENEGTTTVRYSDVQGGWAGTGNLSPAVDPEFVNPDGDDDDPTTWGDNDFHLNLDSPASPCIDTGDKGVVAHLELDLDKLPRVANNCVDMGAYETQVVDPGWENPGDPGLVVVKGEDRVLVEFQVPIDSQYKFSYTTVPPPDRIELWDSLTLGTVIPSDTVYQAGGPEPVCEIDLIGYLAMQRCFSGTEELAPGCESFNLEPDAPPDDDVDLADYGVLQPAGLGPVCNTIPVFVKAVSVSEALSDTVITLLVDDGSGGFLPAETQAVTVASIDITPTSGGLGTELTITLLPAIPPLAFNAATTADWEGVYQPGDPNAMFQVAYDANQFREELVGQAFIVAGDGTVTDPPPFEDLQGPGSVIGVFTLALSGLTLQRTHEFDVDLGNAASWHKIDYVGNGPTLPPPTLGAQADSLRLMDLSSLPDPLSPDATVLENSIYYHYAAVVRVGGDDDPDTPCDDPPVSLLVDFVSYGPTGAEIDRVEDVVFTKVPEDDGDPNNFVYYSDLDRPVIFVDVALDGAGYPTVHLLHAVLGGTTAIVAATD